MASIKRFIDSNGNWEYVYGGGSGSGMKELNVISVKDFGAIGDGVNDDTVAFQDAINNASQNGKILYIPNGNYILTDTPLIPDNTTIIGQSQVGVEIKQNTSWKYHFKTEEAVNVTIENITFIGTTYGGGLMFDNPTGWINDNVYLKHLMLKQCNQGHSISGRGMIMSRFEEVRVIGNNYGGGIALTGAGTSTVMSNCYVSDCKTFGFLLNSQYYSTLISCAAEYNGVGYELHLPYTCSLNSCGAEANVDKSDSPESKYKGVGFYINGGSNCTLNNCYTKDCSEGGIRSMTQSGFSTDGNHLIQGYTYRESSGYSGTPLYSMKIEQSSPTIILINFDYDRAYDFANGKVVDVSKNIIENRTDDPISPEIGRMWLRTDL